MAAVFLRAFDKTTLGLRESMLTHVNWKRWDDRNLLFRLECMLYFFVQDLKTMRTSKALLARGNLMSTPEGCAELWRSYSTRLLDVGEGRLTPDFEPMPHSNFYQDTGPNAAIVRDWQALCYGKKRALPAPEVAETKAPKQDRHARRAEARRQRQAGGQSPVAAAKTPTVAAAAAVTPEATLPSGKKCCYHEFLVVNRVLRPDGSTYPPC